MTVSFCFHVTTRGVTAVYGIYSVDRVSAGQGQLEKSVNVVCSEKC